MTTEPKKQPCRHDGGITQHSFESMTAYGVQTNEYCSTCREFLGCSFKEHRFQTDRDVGARS